MFGGIKKQPAWGHRVARLQREVSRRVTNALKKLESALTSEFPAIRISLIFIEIRAARRWDDEIAWIRAAGEQRALRPK